MSTFWNRVRRRAGDIADWWEIRPDPAWWTLVLPVLLICLCIGWLPVGFAALALVLALAFAVGMLLLTPILCGLAAVGLAIRDAITIEWSKGQPNIR
jgi:hypothetical protein